MQQITTPQKNRFGSTLRGIRLGLRISITDLSQILQVYRSAWCDYENGRRMPNMTTLSKLKMGLQGLGVDKSIIDRLERDWNTSVEASSGKVQGKMF